MVGVLRLLFATTRLLSKTVPRSPLSPVRQAFYAPDLPSSISHLITHKLAPSRISYGVLKLPYSSLTDQICSQSMEGRKGGVIYERILRELFNQIFGVQNPRTGKLRLTRWALQRMNEHQLDVSTLEDTFRYGEEVKKGMIIRKYRNYSVGITYEFEYAEEKYKILTCWKV